MSQDYADVTTRFLRPDERFMSSEATQMPLVIEAKAARDMAFLVAFLHQNSAQILTDISTYGAVLLRGFDIDSEKHFEQAVLSIDGFRGVSEAFMSEEGRVPVGDLDYVLHTNAVYKTGGTLYLGGFHSENYYSPDVPSYICFYCAKPSLRGGETGLVNMERVYASLRDELKEQLEKHTFFVSKWLVVDVAKRYHVSEDVVLAMCHRYGLPVIGQGETAFVLMYKPSVLMHAGAKSLQINLFELPTLNAAMRRCFMNDYRGKDWFWHRFVWRMPECVFKFLEHVYVACASFCYSPRDSLAILKSKLRVRRAIKQSKLPDLPKVGPCFNEQDVNDLAQQIRQHYSSCLWQKGDVLLVDNRKVAHAGMPGAGPRTIRAMIANPLDMTYAFMEKGLLTCQQRTGDSIGTLMTAIQEDNALDAPEDISGASTL